jgi:hypothetical protein
MNHNCSALLALSKRRNRSVYQKTLYLNDWYSTGGPNGEPLGNVQLFGRVSGPILAAQTGLPNMVANLISAMPSTSTSCPRTCQTQRAASR